MSLEDFCRLLSNGRLARCGGMLVSPSDNVGSMQSTRSDLGARLPVTSMADDQRDPTVVADVSTLKGM